MTSAGEAASNGTTVDQRGDEQRDRGTAPPVTTLARPVRAPSPTPAADSM